MTTFVLIHGAFHGGWCWREVASRLRAQGHEVFAPSLTGLADRAHLLSPDIDLDCHIRDITALIDVEGIEDAVLVGHSYGGMPVMGAADQCAAHLRAVVFLDAYVPKDGQSMIAIREAAVGTGNYYKLRQVEGSTIATPSADVFGLEGEQAAFADARLTPHPFGTMTQPIRLSGAWQDIAAKIYLRMTRFPAPYFDRVLGELSTHSNWTAISRDGIHNVMMSEPDWFAGVLLDLA